MAMSLKIDDTLKGRVQHLTSRRSSHWIKLEAVRQYVERVKARENFKQVALASWAAYRETGRHLTGQEVRAWLSTWGEDERALPIGWPIPNEIVQQAVGQFPGGHNLATRKRPFANCTFRED
ncbi:CopG family ribbon-helix-helix protein [Chitinimonas arctica]|uniref:CopG family ribbon-helix-helix protein n=1 Tax=Chitinimonas arctica TaxID=2594795 RepID=UPI001CC6D34C|nr:CopG family ribbon-helix-helix protein [Chitinimonas arctica]